MQLVLYVKSNIITPFIKKSIAFETHRKIPLIDIRSQTLLCVL